MTIRESLNKLVEEVIEDGGDFMSVESYKEEIDHALSAIADEVEKNAEKYPVSDWDDGYNAAIRSICTLIRGQKL